MIKDIKFRKVNTEFEKKLVNNMEKIKNSKQVLTNAAKSSKTYKMTTTKKKKYKKYKKQFMKNVTKSYKRTTRRKTTKIKIEAENIVTKLSIQNIFEQLSE